MSSNVPIVKQVAWISLIPHLTIMGLLILLWYWLDAENPFLNGALTYLILSFCLRAILTKDHKKGIKLVKQEKFLEALPYFERSYDFFKRNDWVDKYRYLTLLVSSKMSYKELDLNNIAFCYGQMGYIVKSKEYYQKTLQEFPDSGLAKAGLRFLTSIEKHNELETKIE